MEEIKNFTDYMNPPINQFDDKSMDYIQGAIDYTGKMYDDMWENYLNVTEKQLKKCMRGTGLPTSKRMEIIEIVKDLLILSEFYYESVIDDGNDRLHEILDDMERQSGRPDEV